MKRAEKEAKAMEPETEEERAEQIRAMREQPDHNMLLHAYKRSGVEPLKLAKYVQPLNLHETLCSMLL